VTEVLAVDLAICGVSGERGLSGAGTIGVLGNEAVAISGVKEVGLEGSSHWVGSRGCDNSWSSGNIGGSQGCG